MKISLRAIYPSDFLARIRISRISMHHTSK